MGTALFIIEKLIWMLAAPSVVLLLLAWAGFVLAMWRRQFWLLGLALAGFSVIAAPPIGPALLAPLENRFPEMTALPANVTGIIVLGGAVSTEVSQTRGRPTLNGDADRMTELVYLARHYPGAELAFTGGNGALVHGAMSEADVAKEIFGRLGLDTSKMVFEDKSRTTYENAVRLKAIVHPQPGQVWLLVTSAWHMPRAMGLFRKAGWDVVAYPVAYKTSPGFWANMHGSFPEGLEKLDAAAHEYVGLAVYWALGKTSALFSGP